MCLTVDDEARLGVIPQNLERLGDSDVLGKAGRLSLKLVFILDVCGQGQNMPCVKSLPIDGVERKGGYLISFSSGFAHQQFGQSGWPRGVLKEAH